VEILGIDIGGSGIKGAPVDTSTGALAADRLRLKTPQPSTPDDVARVVAEIARHFAWSGPIGCTFPAVVQHGVVRTAANVDKAWIGTDGATLLRSSTGCPVTLLNDADAAGVAEMTFGAGQGHSGVVMMLTVGTGIGSAIFSNGVLVPNTELGHLEVEGKEAEHRASDRERKEQDWSWQEWAERLDIVLLTYEALFWPDLFILGGGVSKHASKFLEHLTVTTPIVPAQLLNEAGIVGAALAATAPALP
jgi:polyphosphate glucokinase